MKTSRISILTLLCLLVLLVPQAQALTDKFSLVQTRPATGDFDYARTLGSETLAAGRYRFFSEFDYAYHPLEITVNAQRQGGISDHLLVQHLGIAYGFSNTVEAEIQAPVIWYNQFTAPAAPNAEARFGLGDVFLRTRFQILPHGDYRLGLALSPFLSLPTGDEDDYVSDPRPTGGLVLILDKDLGQRVSLAGNLGVIGRERVVLRDLDRTGVLHFSAAAEVEVSRTVTLKTDFVSQTSLNEPYQKRVASPAELFFESEFQLGQSAWVVTAGGGISVIRGAGMPLYRGLLGLSYGRPIHTD